MGSFLLGEHLEGQTTIEPALRIGWIEAPAPPPRPASDEGAYAFAGWTFDPATRALTGDDGRQAALTASEFALALALVRSPGQPVSRAELLRALRGRDWDYFDRSIDSLVVRLRKKIDAPGAPSLVRSVRGVGYVLCAPVARRPRDGS